MGCSACERRRKQLQALKDKKAAKGKKVQAAALGAALAVSEAVGKAIHGEVEDERDGQGGSGAEPDSGSA